MILCGLEFNMKKFDVCFVDLDDTIYNTHQLRKDIYKIFKPLGISQKEFWCTYRCAERGGSDGYFHYTFGKQINEVRRVGYPAKSSLRPRLEKLIDKDYKLVGADQLLIFLKSICGQVNLLTAGTVSMQARKIKAIKVRPLFDRVIQVAGGKEKVLRPYVLKKKRVLFINDKLSENLAVKSKCPSVEVITVYNRERHTLRELMASRLPWFKKYHQIKKYLTNYESR